jgi:tRNA pseudouridine13 synthase
MDSSRKLPDWPRACGDTLAAAQIRVSNSDFQVTENLGFDLTGTGEHVYLLVRKNGANTQWVADRLAEHAAVRAVDVGFSGLKDRHALTTQWFSIPAPTGKSPDWQGFQAAGVEILEQQRHDRKLKRGVHRSNQFRICLRSQALERTRVTERLQQIHLNGVPNYFGEQRFGHGGSNLDSALQLFAGQRLKKRARGLALSAARSFIFNEILAERVTRGTWDHLLPGDCASLAGSASYFRVEDVDETLSLRCEEFDIHPSAALWGSGPLPTAGEIAFLEGQVAARHAALAEGLARQGLTQSRRATRLVPRDFQWEFVDDGIWLSFELESGAFATSVLRELAAFSDARAVFQRPRNST